MIPGEPVLHVFSSLYRPLHDSENTKIHAKYRSKMIRVYVLSQIRANKTVFDIKPDASKNRNTKVPLEASVIERIESIHVTWTD